MSDNDKVEQVIGYQHMIQSKRERGAPLPIDVAPEDPSSWPYGDETGPPYGDPQRDERQGYSADTVDLAAFTLGPREVLCDKCWMMHRPEVECL